MRKWTKMMMMVMVNSKIQMIKTAMSRKMEMRTIWIETVGVVVQTTRETGRRAQMRGSRSSLRGCWMTRMRTMTQMTQMKRKRRKTWCQGLTKERRMTIKSRVGVARITRRVWVEIRVLVA